MTIKVIQTRTRPTVSIDWNYIPDGIDKDTITGYYRDNVTKSLSENREVSDDSLTFIYTTTFGSLDDYIFENNEGSQRTAIWHQIWDARKALGMTETIQVIDESTNTVIDDATISDREEELNTAGKIRP
jgi:hypothetical protein